MPDSHLPATCFIYSLFCNTGSHGVIWAAFKLLRVGSCPACSWNVTGQFGKEEMTDTGEMIEIHVQESWDQLGCASSQGDTRRTTQKYSVGGYYAQYKEEGLANLGERCL